MSSSSESESEYSEQSAGSSVFEAYIEAVTEAGLKPLFKKKDYAKWDELYDRLATLTWEFFDQP